MNNPILKINLVPMTPEESRSPLSVHYSFVESRFGKILLASTPKGICHLLFCDNESDSIVRLNKDLPHAILQVGTDAYQQEAQHLVCDDGFSETHLEINLHVKGTDFQIQIWKALLDIPFGSTTTYGDIAARIGRPKATRAVGTAIGNNPVSLIIPCHRVINASGKIGMYHWGAKRKRRILSWENNVMLY